MNFNPHTLHRLNRSHNRHNDINRDNYNSLVHIINDYQYNNRIHNMITSQYNSNMNEFIRRLDYDNNNTRFRQTNRINPINQTRNNFTSTESIPTNNISSQDEFIELLMTRISENFSSPIFNGISTDQINLYTTTTYYDNSMNEPSCPITHETFNVGDEIIKINRCGHYFKPQAITRWLSTNNICPVCRAVVDASNNTFEIENTDSNLTHLLNNTFDTTLHDPSYQLFYSVEIQRSDI